MTAGGELFVGTWPEAEVFRYEGGQQWRLIGRVGYEREVMGMALYNGKMHLGTLPTANIWRMDGEEFTFLGTIDQSSAPLRRAWSLAVYEGRLFAGTLLSGRILAIEAGRAATWDFAFPEGWQHIAAVKVGRHLRLYVNGRRVAQSRSFLPEEYDLKSGLPVSIGGGSYEHFTGRMSDVRIYRRALSEHEIGELSRSG